MTSVARHADSSGVRSPSRRRFLDALAATALGACARPAPPRPVPSAGGRRVVMISIDGMRPEYHRQPDRYGLAIPHLRELMKSGVSAEGLESVWPTVTYPAHTTMVTGVRPARHGITTNKPFDPTWKNQGGWHWYSEAIKAPTLWDAARAAGRTTGAIYWPVTVGAGIDWNWPQIWWTKSDFDEPLLRALASRGLGDELARLGPLPTEHRSDDERARAGAWLLREKRPELTLLYLTDLDSEQHHSGPFSPGAIATLERIDAGVGRIVEATRAAGTFDQTTFVVLSDHGFLPVTTTVRPARILQREGLLEADAGGWVKSWRAAPLAAGGMCGIVLAAPRDAGLRAKTGEALARAAADPTVGIRRVYSQEELSARGGFPECAFALEASDGFSFVSSLDGPLESPADHAGDHGYPPERPELRASLILSGRGIRPGATLGLARMIDVAPTVATLLGIDLPSAEGKIIAAALS